MRRRTCRPRRMVPATRNRAATRLQSVLLGRLQSAFVASSWLARRWALRLRALGLRALGLRALLRRVPLCSLRGGGPRAVCRLRVPRTLFTLGLRASGRRRGLRHGGSRTVRRKRSRWLRRRALRRPGRSGARARGGASFPPLTGWCGLSRRLRVRCQLVLSWSNTGPGKSGPLGGPLPLCATVVRQRKWLSVQLGQFWHYLGRRLCTP